MLNTENKGEGARLAGVAAGLVAIVREKAGLPPDAAVEVREEPHCPDPTCPLRHTVIAWMEDGGQKRQVVIVKPMRYVQKADIERALRMDAMLKDGI